MADDNKILADSLSAEAAQAAAIHAEAIEKAREAQMHNVFTKVLMEVLNDDGGSPLLVKRIPFICNDIRDIKNTLWWQSRIAGVIGFVVLTLIAALIATIRIHIG
jgi:hypothetical protein